MRRVRFGDVPREFVVALLAGLLVVLAFVAVAAEGLVHGSVYPRLAQLLEVVTAAGTVAASWPPPRGARAGASARPGRC